MNVKKFFIWALGLICTLSCLDQADEDAAATLTKVGDKVPEFSFEIEEGKTVSISDYKGKLVLINLFATWCPPCRHELPELQAKIWDKHGKNDKFAVLVFGREEDWDVVAPFKAEQKFTFPILPDPHRGVFSKFATQSIPRNILVDENGTIIYQSIGYSPKEFKKLVELINKKLER